MSPALSLVKNWYKQVSESGTKWFVECGVSETDKLNWYTVTVVAHESNSYTIICIYYYYMQSTETLIHAFVTSRLDYASTTATVFYMDSQIAC